MNSADLGGGKTGIDCDVLRESKAELESRVSLSAKMHAVLRQYFGYTSFRPLQEDIIRDVLDLKDVFVLMPTGGGKSLCYQLPALLQEGVTVVVSPLISLMKDQVDGLEANGIAAACMNSTQSPREIRDVKTAFLENRLKILYVAPERLMMPGTISFLKKGNVSLLAIDEAHCISEWGHDFRPEYRKLKLLREMEKGFPGVPVIALTATATERVRKDIVSQLGLAIDKEKGPYVASFNRSNLYYEIRPKKETFSEITDYLRRHRGEAGIIYCQSRNNVEALTKKLNLAGFRALPYHAGLSDSERSRNQEQFIKDDVDIIVATIAFGMGIDKSNVRFVIHYDLPRNLESYYQETGRGGRDGSPCECILFFSRGDRFKIEYFISQKTNEKEKDVALVQLRQMVAYCESNKCRREVLLEYFGEKAPGACGNCDSCLQPKEIFDGTEAAKKLIGCVQELNQRFGTNYVIDVLTGSKTKKIKENRHERLKSHGSGREFTKDQWRAIASEMTNTGLLDVSGTRYPLLKLNAISRKILRGSEQVELVCPEGFVPEAEEASQFLEAEAEEVKRAAGKKDAPERNSGDWGESKRGAGDRDAYEKGAVDRGAYERAEGEMDAYEKNAGERDTYEKEMPPAAVEGYANAADTLKKEKARGAAKSYNEPDPILFERLKALRKQIALKKNLPPYIIFSDTSLKEMASKLPRSHEEFHSITGVGDHKLRKYGDIFLREIDNYRLDYGLAAPGTDDSVKAPGTGTIEPGRKSGAGTEARVLEAGSGVEKPLPEKGATEPECTGPDGVFASPGKKVRRAKYLDTSIQEWSEAGLSRGSRNEPVNELETDYVNELETDYVNELETDYVNELEAEFGTEPGNELEVHGEQPDSLEMTFSLCKQGLGINEIAEIQGISAIIVCRQLEQLVLAGKIGDIEGIIEGTFPPESQQRIKMAVEGLEKELDSILRARLGENSTEEELRLARALFLSKLCFP